MSIVSLKNKQVVLPEEIWETLGLEEGDRLTVTVEAHRGVLTPISTVRGREWRDWQGRLAGTTALKDHVAEHAADMRDGRETTIVDDVRRFIERIAAVRSALPENTLPVLFGYNVHPAARQEAEKADLLLVAAYER